MIDAKDNPTPAAKEAISLAHVQFAGLVDAAGHEHAGSEHLLIGLVNAGESAATHALGKAGFSIGLLQKELLRITTSEGGHAPINDRLLNLVVESVQCARGLGHDYLGTEHLLIVLLNHPNCLATSVLSRAGSTEQLHNEILRAAGSDLSGEAVDND